MSLSFFISSIIGKLYVLEIKCIRRKTVNISKMKLDASYCI